MPPRRKVADPSTDAARWAVDHGATADGPGFLPSWRRAPACIADTVGRLMPNPSLEGFLVGVDGRVEPIRRGAV